MDFCRIPLSLRCKIVWSMNRISLFCKRPFIWLARFRHRCGYGVHSPFAFHLITGVIYEKTPYYKYAALQEEEKRLAPERPKDWRSEPLRVKRLLFRLVNYARPETIVDAGRQSASGLYLRAGREGAIYTAATDLDELFLEADVPVDFLYLHDWRRPRFVEEVFRLCVTRTRGCSVFVIEGIRYTASMRRLWKAMKQDERCGITFDLYDLGIIFFDRTKIKQHYLVNF